LKTKEIAVVPVERPWNLSTCKVAVRDPSAGLRMTAWAGLNSVRDSGVRNPKSKSRKIRTEPPRLISSLDSGEKDYEASKALETRLTEGHWVYNKPLEITPVTMVAPRRWPFPVNETSKAASQGKARIRWSGGFCIAHPAAKTALLTAAGGSI